MSWAEDNGIDVWSYEEYWENPEQDDGEYYLSHDDGSDRYGSEIHCSGCNKLCRWKRVSGKWKVWNSVKNIEHECPLPFEDLDGDDSLLAD